MLHCHLTNFEIKKSYKNEPKFNSVYSRNDLPKIKDCSYAINLDEFISIRIHWIALYLKGDSVTYFDNFGVEYIPKGIKKFISNKNIAKYIYRIQVIAWTLNMALLCIEFIDFIVKGKGLLGYTNLYLS